MTIVQPEDRRTGRHPEAGPGAVRITVALRVIVALIAVLAAVLAISGQANPMFILVSLVPFAVVQAVGRYGWRIFSVYLAVTLVVSYGLENLSIATGFPFGHYHYTFGGLRLGRVPVLIGVIYCALGYVCWIAASALLDGADQRLADRSDRGRRVNLVALPALAGLLMTMFDLGSDSNASTVGHAWIWEQGGGVFGVPWTNYAGWWFVTFVFFQLFTLFLATRDRATRPAAATGREPLAHAVVLYLVVCLTAIPAFLHGASGSVTDATGAVWDLPALHETLMTVNLFGSIAFGLLAVARLARNDLALHPAPPA